MSNWQPAPREYSTLVSVDNEAFLVGGQNYDCNREIAKIKLIPGFSLNDCTSTWINTNFTPMIWSASRGKYIEDDPQHKDRLQGRCRHSNVVHNNKVITFGGCFMYNRKRQVRENTNQLLVYDTKTNCQ